jgi:hypothetical protein
MKSIALSNFFKFNLSKFYNKVLLMNALNFFEKHKYQFHLLNIGNNQLNYYLNCQFYYVQFYEIFKIYILFVSFIKYLLKSFYLK